MKPYLTKVGLISVFLFSFGLLLPNTAPHITTGDAAELALSGTTLGVAHSPGYPLFTMFNNALGNLLVMGNPAYRQNLISVFLISLTLVFLGYLIMVFTGQRWSMAVPLLLLFSGVVRHHAYVTEVFPLSVCWGVMIIGAVVCLRGMKQRLVLIFFLFGLGIVAHQTLILMVPAVAFYVLNQKEFNWKKITIRLPLLVLFLIIGLSLFIYLPIRSSSEPLLDWEDPETWGRFWGVITRSRYGFFKLTQGEGLELSFFKLWDVFVFSKNFLISNVGWIGVGLLFIGTLQALARPFYRRMMVFLWLLILFTGPFFYWIANVQIHDNTDVFMRFTLFPLCVSVLIMGIGVGSLWTSRVILYRIFLTFLIVGFIGEGFFRNPYLLNQNTISEFRDESKSMGSSMRWELSLREYAENILKSAPKKAVIFSDRADETEFSLYYLLSAEEKRTDVAFVDCNAGVTKSIYGDDYYDIWGKARLNRRVNVEQKRVNSENNPVFYATLDPAMIDLVRTPWGLLHRAWPFHEVKEAEGFTWNKIFLWRFYPRETRGIHLFQTNLNLLGRSFFERGITEAAISSFGLVQRAGGAHRFEIMGYWHQVRGELGKALAFYRQAFAAGDVSEALFSNMGALQFDLGRVDEAVAIYQHGLKRYQASIKILYNLALARWQQGDREETKLLIEKIISLDPKNQNALDLAARL